MLEEMTPEWAKVANSLAVFVELKRSSGEEKPKSFIPEYNDWLHWSGIEMDSPDLAEWATAFLKALYETPSSLTKAALDYDGIPIASMKPVPKR